MYAKLFSSIIHSTVWREPMHVKVVWITMLAMANRHGEVQASLPGLADAAKVELTQCEDALNRLAAPDAYSRTKEYEGRRIAAMDGGWLIFNYVKHRDSIDKEEEREKTRQRVAKHRAKKKEVTESPDSNAPKQDVRPVASATPSDQINSDQIKTSTEYVEGATNGARAKERRETILQRFTDVFNAAYNRNVSAPPLNGSQGTHFRKLITAYGPDGVCCLPIIAARFDARKADAEERRKNRIPAHLLRDGEKSYEWSTLLQQADTLDRRSAEKAYAVAHKFGLESALQTLGVPRG